MAKRRQQNRRGVQAAQARPASHAAKAGADLFESTAGAVGARLVGSRSMVALMGVAGSPRSLSKGKSIMKRARALVETAVRGGQSLPPGTQGFVENQLGGVLAEAH
jgi:hypothetical protein